MDNNKSNKTKTSKMEPDEIHDPFKKIGLIFKRTREDQKLSLDKVNKDIGIKSIFLQAIEAGDFEKLPGQVYAIGFIKLYGNYLDINTEQLIYDLKNSTPAKKSNIYSPIMAQKEPNKIPTRGIITVAIILGVLAYGVYWFVHVGSLKDLKIESWRDFLSLNVNDKSLPKEVKQTSLSNNSKQSPPSTSPTQSSKVNVGTPQEGNSPQEKGQSNDEKLTLGQNNTLVSKADDTNTLQEVQPSQGVQPPIESGIKSQKTTLNNQNTDTLAANSSALTQTQTSLQNPSLVPKTGTSKTLALLQTLKQKYPDALFLGDKDNPKARVVIGIEQHPVWLSIQQGTKNVIHKTLKPTSFYIVAPRQTPQEKTYATIGNAGNTTIYINGIKQPALGRAGQVLRHYNLDPVILEQRTQ